MRDTDAEEFGAIVDTLVGARCARTLATNSIKLHFDTEQDPTGRRYIWIDPPWTSFEGDRFAHGYRLVVPHRNEPVFEDAWYVHRYAAETC